MSVSPWAEAHGGYTYCGLAAAVLCGRPDRLDLPELLYWLAQRQAGPGPLHCFAHGVPVLNMSKQSG